MVKASSDRIYVPAGEFDNDFLVLANLSGRYSKFVFGASPIVFCMTILPSTFSPEFVSKISDLFMRCIVCRRCRALLCQCSFWFGSLFCNLRYICQLFLPRRRRRPRYS